MLKMFNYEGGDISFTVDKWAWHHQDSGACIGSIWIRRYNVHTNKKFAS
jgi:hypothetical protein